MLGVLLCSSVQAKWVKFGANKEGSLYYDSESIIYMLGGRVSIREKNVLNEANRENPNPEDYAYSVARNIFNCALKQYNVMSHHEYSIDNKLLISHEFQAEEQPNDVIPGTIAEALMKIACKKTK